MKPTRRVLIVDKSPEGRQVLRVALERLGAEAVEADRPEQAVAITASEAPDLIVLDADSDRSDNHTASRDLQRAAGRSGAPIVVLGTVAGRFEPSAPDCVPKPYHYGPLIRKIEGLLAGRRAA